MTTSTVDRLSRASHTELGVVAGTDGARARVRTLTTAHPDAPVLRPVLLGSGRDWARVALVAEGALLLAGDRVTVSVDVGPGVRLTVIEPSGVVAYAMRGRNAAWNVDIYQRTGSSLVWQGQPFVVAAGAVVDRRTSVDLHAGARLLLRETLVLGRTGEAAGTVRTRSEVRRCGLPVLVEELALGPAAQVPGILGHHRVVDSVLALGRQALEHTARLDLDAEGHLYRDLVRQTHESGLGCVWDRLEQDQSVTEV